MADPYGSSDDGLELERIAVRPRRKALDRPGRLC